MYSVLKTLSKYTYFYISKDITSYTFWLVFEIFESIQCILKEILLYSSFVKSFDTVRKRKLYQLMLSLALNVQIPVLFTYK